MMAHAESYSLNIIHVPATSVDWAGILTQFALYLSANESKQFATWASERLLRITKKNDAVVALQDGELLGFMLFEITDNAAEFTFPWTKQPNPYLARELALAAAQTVRETYPDIIHIRTERQLLPGQADPHGLTLAGFTCHWRYRMQLTLPGWREATPERPGYHLARWNVRYLDAAADVVYRANLGTIDAELYAPFFGDSTRQCRKGLLTILAGRYGPIHPLATLCAFAEDQLVGVNLVIDEGGGKASIVEISVDPEHQGKGLGRLLMTRGIRALKQEGFELVELAVTRDNYRAVNLYESLGFATISDFPVCVMPVDQG